MKGTDTRTHTHTHKPKPLDNKHKQINIHSPFFSLTASRLSWRLFSGEIRSRVSPIILSDHHPSDQTSRSLRSVLSALVCAFNGMLLPSHRVHTPALVAVSSYAWRAFLQRAAASPFSPLNTRILDRTRQICWHSTTHNQMNIRSFQGSYSIVNYLQQG